MFSIKFRGKTFVVRLIMEGFKVNTVGTGKWNYIHFDDIKNYVRLINNTGRVRLSVPMDERSVFNLPNDFSVFRNIALIVKLLYPEKVSIKGKYAVLSSRINFDINDFYERRNRLFLENRTYVIDDDRITCSVKGQKKLTEFRR